MKISPMNAYNVRSNYQARNVSRPVTTTMPEEQPEFSFKGKHQFAKGLAGICGVLGVLGATGGILIMTGGLGAAALPWIAGYGAATAGTGAILGHQIDKAENDNKKENE